MMYISEGKFLGSQLTCMGRITVNVTTTNAYYVVLETQTSRIVLSETCIFKIVNTSCIPLQTVCNLLLACIVYTLYVHSRKIHQP